MNNFIERTRCSLNVDKRETGVNPVRSRHCEGEFAIDATVPMAREGVASDEPKSGDLPYPKYTKVPTVDREVFDHFRGETAVVQAHSQCLFLLESGAKTWR